MMHRKGAILAAVAGLGLLTIGCEEKKPTPPAPKAPPAPTGTAPATGTPAPTGK